MTAEEYQDSLDEWDTIFDPADKPEYSQEQLIRFAELFAEYKLKQKQVLRALRRELTRIGLADIRFGSKDLIDETEL